MAGRVRHFLGIRCSSLHGRPGLVARCIPRCTTGSPLATRCPWHERPHAAPQRNPEILAARFRLCAHPDDNSG